jgi:hypothetical protein
VLKVLERGGHGGTTIARTSRQSTRGQTECRRGRPKGTSELEAIDHAVLSQVCLPSNSLRPCVLHPSDARHVEAVLAVAGVVKRADEAGHQPPGGWRCRSAGLAATARRSSQGAWIATAAANPTRPGLDECRGREHAQLRRGRAERGAAADRG